MTPEEKAREHADFAEWESEIEFLDWAFGPTGEELRIPKMTLGEHLYTGMALLAVVVACGVLWGGIVLLAWGLSR